MIPFIMTVARFVRAMIRSLNDPEFRALGILAVITVMSGTVFFSMVEGWSLLDSLYFSVITLTTIGYGDLSPTTPFSKIFTILYIVIGVGIFLGFINKLSQPSQERGKEQTDRD